MRQEAVQQALAEMQKRPKPSLPMPSKRTSMMAKSPDRERHDLCKYIHLLSVTSQNNPNYFETKSLLVISTLQCLPIYEDLRSHHAWHGRRTSDRSVGETCS